MKSQKGITLTSLIIYVLVVIVVTGILATIMANFQSNLKEINGKASREAEFDKFNVYFIKEVKILGNKVSTISEAKNEIVFESGNKYTFRESDNSIYLNDNIKISENIQRCTFSNSLVDGKDIVTVVIKVIDGEGRTIEYVLNNATSNLEYEDESYYVHQGSNGPWSEDLKAGTVTNGKITLKIGDYVNYEKYVSSVETKEIYKELQDYSGYEGSTYETDYPINTEEDLKLKWRVLDEKDGQIRLISENPTKTTVYLKGYQGYNNAVYLIDKVCSTLYTTQKGSAENLKIEDIQSAMDLDTWDYHNYSSPNTEPPKYGGIKEYTEANSYYPEIYTKEKKGHIWDKNKGIYIDGTELDLSEQTEVIKQDAKVQESPTSDDKIKIEETFWSKQMSKESWTNETYQNIFINDSSDSNYDEYWISSRCVHANSNYANFDVINVKNGGVNAQILYRSNNSGSEMAASIRPVVLLSLSIDFLPETEKIEDVWQIRD